MNLPSRVSAGAKRAAELIKKNGGQPAADVVVESEEKLKEQLAKANAEVERLTAESTALRTRQSGSDKARAAAESELAKEKERAKELEGKLAKKIESGEVLSLNEDERQLAGKDLLGVISKVAREAAHDAVTKGLLPVTQRLENFQRMSEAQYDAFLDEQLPDFDKQNNDPKFVAWLGQTDPATGRTRQQLVAEANALLQGYRVVEIFRAFKEGREIGVRQEPNGLEHRQAPAREEAGHQQPNLDEDGKKRWSRAEIAKYYRDVREGLYRGKEDEARKIEQEIFLAQRENRVR